MSYNILVLDFAEARQPAFKERKGKGYIEFGEKNDYPNYLVSLFNKSAKHNAIIRGKVNYITGNGWSVKEEDAVASQFIDAPNSYENLSDLTRKVASDIEIFGGYYLQISWAVGGVISEIIHIDYTKFRSNKDNTQFWYKENWKDNREEAKVFSAFNPSIRKGIQILYVKEYRPSIDTYSLPNYIGSLNYIESDIEVSKHVLGNAQTGFSASKLITLPNGEPEPDEKRDIESRFRKQFSGADGKKFILSFVNDASRKPIVDDLGASDLTKEDFGKVDEIIQQNIFAGHQITTPSLFGIMVNGSLGTRTEMRDGYEIFKNTYVNDKQIAIETVFNMLARLKGTKSDIYIVPVEPISFEFSEAILSQNMTKDEIREKLNLPIIDTTTTDYAQKVLDSLNSLSPLVANKVLESMSQNEIRNLVGLSMKEGGDTITPTSDITNPITPDNTQAMVNEHLKGMKGREWQNFQRIIREFNKGKISREQASQMLKSAYALDDESVNTWLGEDDAQFSNDIESVLQVFEQFGESKNDYTILQSKTCFNADEIEELEFRDAVISDKTDKSILELISKNKNIGVEDIAKALKIKSDLVVERINVLKDLKYIDYNTKTNTTVLKKPLSEIIDKPITKTYVVRYSYEWKKSVPQSERDTALHPSRYFCHRLMSMDKLFSRTEIERMSGLLGFSVFDRGGGWWTMPNGKHSPSCRHEWKSNIVVKKK